MVFVVKGTNVHRPPERVSIFVPVMPQRTNLAKDQRLLTYVFSKPSLELVSISMKPSTERPQEGDCKVWWLIFGVTMVFFVGYPLLW